MGTAARQGPAAHRDGISARTELVFAHREDYVGKTLKLACDELTEPQIAATLAKVIGRTVQLPQVTMPEGGPPSEAQISTHRIFNGEGYSADIQWVWRLYPALRTFEQWLRETGCENALVEPMPPTGSRWKVGRERRRPYFGCRRLWLLLSAASSAD